MSKKWRVNKRFSVHFIIIASFILYLLSSNYIFDKMLLVKGESKSQEIDFPKDTNKIVYSIDKLNNTKREWKELIYIGGWAFVKGQDAINNSVYVVLQSDDRTYIFDTVSMKRPGVTDVFGKPAHLNLDNSGFQAYISKGLIENGRYNIGIYIRNDNGEFFTMGNKYLNKSNEGRISGGVIKSENNIKLIT